MKHTVIAGALALLLAAAPAVFAQTPALIPYQGRVQTGTPAADFTGTGNFKFALIAGGSNTSVQATATATRTEVSNGTAPAFQILPGKLFGTADATATTFEMSGINTIAIWDHFSVFNDISFPGDAGHTISVKPTTTNTDGSPLTIRAGDAQPGGTFAKRGGDLVLMSGAGYGNFQGINGGDIYIATADVAVSGTSRRGNIYLEPGNGMVGLNTRSPGAPLHVSGGNNNSFLLVAYLDGGGAANPADLTRSERSSSMAAKS